MSTLTSPPVLTSSTLSTTTSEPRSPRLLGLTLPDTSDNGRTSRCSSVPPGVGSLLTLLSTVGQTLPCAQECADVPGLGLNSSIILSTIGFGTYTKGANAMVNHYQTLHNVAVGNIILAVGGLIPGYYLSFFFIDSWGRKKIQLMGFTILTIIFVCMGFGYDKMMASSGGKKAFVFLVSWERVGWASALSSHARHPLRARLTRSTAWPTCSKTSVPTRPLSVSPTLLRDVHPANIQSSPERPSLPDTDPLPTVSALLPVNSEPSLPRSVSLD